MLEQVRGPRDLKGLTPDQMDAWRPRSVRSWSTTCPGPAATWVPNLGVVELTLALHRVFDSPRDTIIWDTGHRRSSEAFFARDDALAAAPGNPRGVSTGRLVPRRTLYRCAARLSARAPARRASLSGRILTGWPGAALADVCQLHRLHEALTRPSAPARRRSPDRARR